MPAQSMAKALKRADVSLKELKRIEINEAFAAVPLVSTKVLSDGDAAVMEQLGRSQTSTAAPSPSAIPPARAARGSS
jgi:acetyl-CoA acetyltransferase